MQHVTDDSLDQFAMRTLPDVELVQLEEHLLMCSECRDRLDEEIEFVTAMRGAAVKMRNEMLS